jgi:ribosomal protein S18 acetylase RimI-like enzyme
VTAALHLAGPQDIERLLPMVAAYHAEEGIESDAAHRRAGLGPLLQGSPLGAVYLIGPRAAPVGYIVISFGWSLEFAGMDGYLDEFWIRPGVRGRGLGSEVLAALIPALEAAGLRALRLEAGTENEGAQRLYARHGFVLRDGFHLMTRTAP